MINDYQKNFQTKLNNNLLKISSSKSVLHLPKTQLQTDPIGLKHVCSNSPADFVRQHLFTIGTPNKTTNAWRLFAR